MLPFYFCASRSPAPRWSSKYSIPFRDFLEAGITIQYLTDILLVLLFRMVVQRGLRLVSIEHIELKLGDGSKVRILIRDLSFPASKLKAI